MAKILIIGYGSIGKRHTTNLLHNTNHEIIIFTQRKNLKFKTKNVKVYNSIKKCLSEKPQIGFITNETSLHVKYAILLANSGIDLFLEKPLSNSMNKIELLRNTVKRKKLITQMGFNLRFHKCIIKIKKLIEEQKIGKIISIQSENGSYLPDWHPYEDYRIGYAGKKKLGGGIILTQIHDVDYLYWLFGNPLTLFSINGKFSNLDITAEDYANSIIQFKNRITAQLHLDFFQGPEYRQCKIKGTNGIIYWNSLDNEVKVYDNKKKKWITILKLKSFQRNQMYVDEIKHFLKCVKERKQTINNIDQGINTMKIALAMKQSQKDKKMIELK